MKTCKNCGTECNDAFLFCKNCGQRSEAAEPAPAESAAGAVAGQYAAAPAIESVEITPPEPVTPAESYPAADAVNPPDASVQPAWPAAESPVTERAEPVYTPYEPWPAYTPPPVPLHPDIQAGQATLTRDEPPGPITPAESYPAADAVKPPDASVQPAWSAANAAVYAQDPYTQPAYAQPDAAYGQPPAYAPPVYPAAENTYAAPEQTDEESDKAIGLVRRMLGSPMVILLAVFGGLQFILSLYKLFSAGGAATYLNDIEILIDKTFTSEFISTMDSTYLVSGIIALLPGLLITLGWLLTYMAAKNKQMASMSTAGLTIIRMVLIVLISLVGLAVAAGAVTMLLGIVIGDFESVFFKNMPDHIAVVSMASVFAALATFGVAVIAVLAVFLRAFGSAVKTIRSGKPDRRYMETAGYIALILGILGCIGTFTSLLYINSPLLLLISLLAAVLTAAQYILAGILALKASRRL